MWLAAVEALLHFAPRFFQGTHHAASQQLDQESVMGSSDFLDDTCGEPVGIVERFE